eukprot:CAMPEP_0168356084 /NCGR_PEP_ID=MMETSP0213-20121227/24946_1 /TAXON_ID=151035 /ORGANISM="Euplotes harpa, Strain FSP1.4" /LENGTH=195 /DNA_ID=CAMNT_0008368439 /DNA_START=91 /DNA_END=678 /DNA_ORIENTATION=-
MKYGKLSFQFYCTIPIICFMYPVICMQISKKILDLLRLIHENKELIKTIRHILLSFPEAVLIRAKDEGVNRMVLKFVNLSAQSQLIPYEQPEDKPINDELLQFDVKETSERALDSFDSEDLPEKLKFSEILSAHEIMIENNQAEIVSHIEIVPKGNEPERGDDVVQSFDLKTIKVNWDKTSHAYMHSFVNTTHIK